MTSASGASGQWFTYLLVTDFGASGVHSHHEHVTVPLRAPVQTRRDVLATRGTSGVEGAHSEVSVSLSG